MCDSDKFTVNNTKVKDKVEHFEKNVLFNRSNIGKVVYMFFKADWCGNCTRLLPTFLKYRKLCSDNKKDDMIMVIIDSDTAPELTKEYKITGFPFIYVYKIDDNLINNKNNKLDLTVAKIIGNDPPELARVMKEFSKLSL